MDLKNLTDDQVSAFADGLARLISDLESGKDTTIQAANPTETETSQATEIQAAAKLRGLRCALTGYQAAIAATGASLDLQTKIEQIKSEIRAMGKAPQPYAIGAGSWCDNYRDPALELDCCKAELEAVRSADLDPTRHLALVDRIRQLEIMVSRGER